MSYFCSFSYVDKDIPKFGNAVLDVDIDPYENIIGFRDKVEEYVSSETGESIVILLNYKRVM